MLLSTVADDDQESPVPWSPGWTVARRYLLERKLGGGAMGEVWLAEDLLLRKPVALKVLQEEFAQKRDTVRRFLREVALAHQVTHPHVVRIYDTGEEGGLPFFTMEYLQGKTLQELLDDPHGGRASDRLDVQEIRRIAYDVLDGMAAAHRVGVIHRDLKPGNVMLTHRGAIVMDFGVAGIEEAPAGTPSASTVRALIRTEAGTIFGSPAYMPPELWEGEPASIQSDLYAFGVMLYQMLTGRLPYEAKTPAGYLQQLSIGRVVPARTYRRDTPWYLVRLVRRCMALNPLDRPTNAQAAANLIAPLRGKNRQRVVLASIVAVTIAATALVYGNRDSFVSRGLPDHAAEVELAAALQTYDFGDTEAALRQLDRLARRAPRAAGVVFWRSTMLHELGDDRRRRRLCDSGDLDGNELWKDLATQACGPRYRFASSAVDELVSMASPSAPELLSVAVRHHIVPALETAPHGAPVFNQANELISDLDNASLFQDGALFYRLRLAQVDLELGLGRVNEAAQRTMKLANDYPDVPAISAKAAWFATRLGNEERAIALAQMNRAIDPAPWAVRQMAQGQMRSAWREVEARFGSSSAEYLRAIWCGYAYRYEFSPLPSKCSDLPPSLISALVTSPIDSTNCSTEIDAAVAKVADEHANGSCPAREPAATLLTHATPPFETWRAELALESVLAGCNGDPPDMALAEELGASLATVGHANPWVLLILAKLDDRRGEPGSANARRLAALERWRDADLNLPLVARLRRQVDQPMPSGPLTASQEQDLHHEPR